MSNIEKITDDMDVDDSSAYSNIVEYYLKSLQTSQNQQDDSSLALNSDDDSESSADIEDKIELSSEYMNSKQAYINQSLNNGGSYTNNIAKLSTEKGLIDNGMTGEQLNLMNELESAAPSIEEVVKQAAEAKKDAEASDSADVTQNVQSANQYTAAAVSNMAQGLNIVKNDNESSSYVNSITQLATELGMADSGVEGVRLDSVLDINNNSLDPYSEKEAKNQMQSQDENKPDEK